MFLLFYTDSLFAQLSPGKLHQVHKDLEGVENCTKCHVSGKKLTPGRCLDCHKLLKARIDKGEGLHANKDFKECQKCHIEHQGRKSQLIYWKEGRDNFNHEKTGFKLEGAHAKLKCEKCHNENNIVNKEKLKKQKKDLNHTFLGLDQRCLSCHIDEHRGQLAENCTNCHNLEAWKPAPRFDHAKTKFILTGKHQKVECQKCHVVKTDKVIGEDKSYLNFKIQKFNRCLDCHKDQHQGRFGKKCEKCHTTRGWKDYNQRQFNHDLTPFPLKGRHKTVECAKCHKNPANWRIARYQQCIDCHENYHIGQFKDAQKARKCETCHTVEGFSPAKFTMEDHEKTDYPLKGAHKAVPCILCHKKVKRKNNTFTQQFKFSSTRCAACHKDPHGGQVDRYKKMKSQQKKMDGCEHCHSVEGWNLITFAHSLTKFNLEGRHQEVACQACHKPDKRTVVRFSGIAQQCENCHEDKHHGQFKADNGQTDCNRCHSPSGWKAEKFNHDRDARFKLTGAHQKVACKSCHPVEGQGKQKFVRYKPLAFSCQACHGNKFKQPGEQ